jgi:predicted permease
MIETRDNLESDARIALVSERWLERHPEARPGSVLTIDGGAVEIAGVLPANAVLPEELEAGGAPIDLWLPLWLDPSEPARNTHLFRAIGLLAEGSDAERAGAELARLTGRLTEALPSVYTPGFMSSSGFRTVVRPLRSDVTGGIARVLWMLLGAVGIVLTIAAANVANLFLVRAEGRRRETAVRTALGAGRGHLLTSFCAETLLLAVLACAVALPLAVGAVRVVTLVAPQGLPRLDSVSVGAPTAGFVLLTGLVVGLGLGLVPFARRRMDLSLLRGEGRAHTADRRSVSARSFLVITQFTLALILLSSAALLLRSFLRMRAADPGLDGTGVHTFSIHVPATARYSSFTSAGVFQRGLTERVAALPSVESASLTDYVPLTGPVGCTVIFSREVPLVPDAIPPCVTVASVGPDFFTILGIPVRGGVSDWTEMQNGIGGAVVSQSLARRLWPGRDAIGMTIRANNPAEPYYRVIGVAGDVHGEGIERPPVEAVYFPLVPAEDALISSAPPQTLTLILRAGSDPPDLPASVRAALAEIAPDAALGHVQSMGSIVAGSTARVSFAASLLLLAGLIALTLSAVGIYGVMGFLVRQRQAEIGVRMALGASASQVWRMIVRQSLAMAGPGIALGLVLAWIASNALRSLLFEVEPGDPLAIGIAATILLAVAIIACTAPARRAASLDPAHALHGES